MEKKVFCVRTFMNIHMSVINMKKAIKALCLCCNLIQHVKCFDFVSRSCSPNPFLSIYWGPLVK